MNLQLTRFKDGTKERQTVAGLSFDLTYLRKMGEAATPMLNSARTQATHVQSMSNIKQICLAIYMYAEGHNGQLPNSLDDLKPVLGEETFKRVMKNPITGDDVGYTYEKPAEKMVDVKKPSEQQIIFELKDGKKCESGNIGFADGHVERVQPKANPSGSKAAQPANGR